MGFNKSKWWYFGNYNKSLHIEVAGWKSTPHIIFQVDGEDRGIMFSISIGIAIYIVLKGFLPKSWCPTYLSKYGSGKIPEDREISIRLHGGAIWWDFWVSEEWASYCANRTWRQGSFNFMDKIKGKHDYRRDEADRRQFLLPFLEGIYNVEVIRWDRTDKWLRWPTHRMTTWEVRAGYYEGAPNEINWKDRPIPVEGKGENSWDCDEDATWSISFPGAPYKTDIATPYLAALHFWNSMMKSREQRGSVKWIPKGSDWKDLKIMR